MQIKLLAVFAFVLCALAGLLVRITMITTQSGSRYAKQVLSQQNYDSRTIPYRRGEIRDTNGIILAKSDRVYNVVLDCYEINSKEDYIEPTIEALGWTRRRSGIASKMRRPGTAATRSSSRRLRRKKRRRIRITFP